MAENIPNIYRIIIPVSDAVKAVNFYSELFNLKGRNVGGGRYYFDCGSIILAILESKKPSISDYIYFSMADVEEIYARAKYLDCLSTELVHGEKAGEIIIRPWGERCFYAYDPFGNGLCFVDEKTIFTGK